MSGALPLHDAHGTSGAASARADAAYAHLKTQLLEGDWGPGTRLSVVELARQLGCSRVPVMEALKRLANDGLVQIVPQVGCRVVSPSPAEVRDFFTLFAAAEGTVSAFAAARRTAADVVAFERLCTDIDQRAASAGGPAEHDPTWRRLNLLFHGSIHQLARSPLTAAIAATMWDRSDFYIKSAYGSLYFSRAVKAAHHAIRAAIIAGDADGARRATAAHLEAVGDGVARAMARQDSVSP
ncbi:MAG: GntR family transcriptional regulator [Gammaproteobacteria bacterium]